MNLVYETQLADELLDGSLQLSEVDWTKVKSSLRKGASIVAAASALSMSPMSADARQTSQSGIEQMQVGPNEFVSAILRHEGLAPGQTPFRITSRAMRSWNKIHGYEVDRVRANVPKNRDNFIYLKRAGDVPKAVLAQLVKYVRFPQRYGFKSVPTVKQALAKFDQTGVQGKIEYLKKALPGLDVNSSLASVISESLS